MKIGKFRLEQKSWRRIQEIFATDTYDQTNIAKRVNTGEPINKRAKGRGIIIEWLVELES